MDAGPGLNFLSINKERLLFSVLGPLYVPESVRDEVLTKANSEERFRPASRVLSKLPERLLEVLSDDFTDDLAGAVFRISGQPMTERRRTPRDLGETMVLAHAAVAAEAGHDVFVLIDERVGGRKAEAEGRRLDRIRSSGRAVGSIRRLRTASVLAKAAGGQYLPDRGAMRETYLKMRGLDDGLVPLDKTNLMNLPCWNA